MNLSKMFPHILKLGRNKEFQVTIYYLSLVTLFFRIIQYGAGVAGQESDQSGRKSSPPTEKSISVILDDFIILRKRLTWIEAISECANQSKQLAALPTVQDAKLLVEEIRAISQAYYDNYSNNRKSHEFGMDRRYWIGLTDLIREGDWQWVGAGSDLDYNFWYKDKPNHVSGGKPKHCACLANPSYQLGDHHQFIDDDCTKRYYAICGELLKPTPSIPAIFYDVDEHMSVGVGYIDEDEQNDNDTSLLPK
ncbi:Hepatic lectin [Orchesella cincta]|uniref:Hepatic lectin n=1 Tax=Orchesella cincta TaxID=48709 RepID=A0A1D2MZ18_ORCCI|nr:Hepatic lectin [Orchesella cincta]